MAHRPQPNRSLAALRTLLTVLAATTALAGCYETSPPPGACTTEFAPVCGDDGVTYANTCMAGEAGAAIAHAGPCRTGNTCTADGDCDIGAVCMVPRCAGVDAGAPPACLPGEPCPEPVPPRCDAPGTCEACVCDTLYAPVCSVDGVTYGNECEARCAHATVASSGECGTVCTPLACPPIWCEFGYRVDAAGCSTCECNPPPMCPPVCDLYCPYGNVIDARGCELCECNPPPTCGPAPLCGLYCEWGYARDARGCETCECNPPPPICDDVLCDLYCEFGYALDERGCPTCSCNPPVPSELCSSDAECGPGAYCDYSMPVCGGPICAPDEPCPPSMCWGSCRPISTCAPVACFLYCEFGFARDATGCEICMCNEPPPPPPPVRLCLDSSYCAMGEYCDHTVCFTAPCPPGMACPDVCYGACFGGPSSGGGSADGGVPTPSPTPR